MSVWDPLRIEVVPGKVPPRKYCRAELRRACFYLINEFLEIEKEFPNLKDQTHLDLKRNIERMENAYTYDDMREAVEKSQKLLDVLFTEEASYNIGLASKSRRAHSQVIDMCKSTTCLCDKRKKAFDSFVTDEIRITTPIDKKNIGNSVYTLSTIKQ